MVTQLAFKQFCHIMCQSVLINAVLLNIFLAHHALNMNQTIGLICPIVDILTMFNQISHSFYLHWTEKASVKNVYHLLHTMLDFPMAPHNIF